VFCLGTQLSQCNDPGPGVTVLETCLVGCTEDPVAGCQCDAGGDADCRPEEHCDDGVCVPDVCQEGIPFCEFDGETWRAMLCNDNGSSNSLLEECLTACKEVTVPTPNAF